MSDWWKGTQGSVKDTEENLTAVKAFLGMVSPSDKYQVPEYGKGYAILLANHKDIYEEYVGKSVDKWTASQICRYYQSLKTLCEESYGQESWPRMMKHVKTLLSDYSKEEVLSMVDDFVINFEIVKNQNPWIESGPSMGLLFFLRDKIITKVRSGGHVDERNRVNPVMQNETKDDGSWW